MRPIVDTDHVYWTEDGFDGAVWRAPKAGGAATQLSKSPPTANESVGIAVDDTSVYWGNGDGGVYSAPKAGGPATVLLPATADGASSGFVIDDAYLYALMDTPSLETQLVKLPKAGGSPVVLADALEIPSSLAADADNIYWIAASATVNSVPKSGGAVVEVSDAETAVMVLAADASGVYGLDIQCNLLELPGNGAKPVVLAGASSNAAAFGAQIALDATDIYWSASSYGIPQTETAYRIPKVGGAEVQLATCDLSPEGGHIGIAVDSTFVYWPAGNPEALLALVK